MDWCDLADLTASVAVADQLRLEHIPAGSNRDDEMHVDGGVVSQVFLFPRIVLLAQLK
jgi:hypothetical protein